MSGVTIFKNSSSMRPTVKFLFFFLHFNRNKPVKVTKYDNLLYILSYFLYFTLKPVRTLVLLKLINNLKKN